MDSTERILDAIDSLRTEVAITSTNVKTLQEDVRKYNNIKDRVFGLEADRKTCLETIDGIKENCKAIQMAKAARQKPWIALLFTVMGGIILILAGIVIELMVLR